MHNRRGPAGEQADVARAALAHSHRAVRGGRADRQWRLEPPRREPRFEGIVREAPGPVKEFAFKDVQGKRHTLADWADRPGIVLIFLATRCPVSEAYAPEIARLARAYSGRGIAFYGIHSDPDASGGSAANHASARGLNFPILLDPDQLLARQLDARVTPSAYLLASDGQVLLPRTDR